MYYGVDVPEVNSPAYLHRIVSAAPTVIFWPTAGDRATGLPAADPPHRPCGR